MYNFLQWTSVAKPLTDEARLYETELYYLQQKQNVTAKNTRNWVFFKCLIQGNINELKIC